MTAERRELIKLMGFVTTCRTTNSVKWMEMLADRVNAAQKVLDNGLTKPVEFDGRGLSPKGELEPCPMI